MLKGFYYNDELYIRLIPAKSLFKSTMVHEVVTRGDVFGLRCSDSQFTIIPVTAQVVHVDIHPMVMNTELPEAEKK